MTGTDAPPLPVWVHGARAEVHDYQVSRPGAFARLVAQLAVRPRSETELIVSTALTRSNYGVLHEMPDSLAEHGAKAWRVAVPRVDDAQAEDPRRSAPEGAVVGGVPFARLALAMPHALRALARASRAGIEVYVTGAPLCLLGPYAAQALPSAPRAYGAACSSCPARPACPGIDAGYLARFAGDELRPRGETRPPPMTPRAEGLRAQGEAWGDAVAAPSRGGLPVLP